MLGLLQRVSQAAVSVEGQEIARIGPGLLVLVGVERDDERRNADRLCQRLLGYRVFEDDLGKMNLSLAQIGGGLLLVSQFTLPADTAKGMRPSFTPAAPPELGRRLYDYLVERAQEAHPLVQTGRFGAHMAVSLVNDGPVTFMLKT